MSTATYAVTMTVLEQTADAGSGGGRLYRKEEALVKAASAIEAVAQVTKRLTADEMRRTEDIVVTRVWGV